MLAAEEFGRLFETFERTAFRLETLAVYDVDEEREEIVRFLTGEDMGPDWDDNPWVRPMTDKGKSVSRVQVLRSRGVPPVRTGRIPRQHQGGRVHRDHRSRRAGSDGLPDHDFWLLDDRDVYRMHYTPEGKFVAGEHLPADRLAEYQGYRDVALTHAVPFASYWERHH
jgi:hypothetical protein